MRQQTRTPHEGTCIFILLLTLIGTYLVCRFVQGVTALCGTVLAVLRQMLNDNILVRGMVRLLLYTGVSIQNPHTN